MLRENSVKNLLFNRSVHLVIVSFFLVLVWQIPDGQTQTNDSTTASLHVISDKMVGEAGTSFIEFIGNVKATRLDSTVLADSIKIYFNVEDKNKTDNDDTQGNVKKIVATGNVEYTAGERKAFADKAIYTTLDEVLILTGKAPKLLTGSSFVSGKKITLFRKQDKVIVESDGSKRVEARFNPEDNITEKQ